MSIAENQKKVALFEKRYEAYDVISLVLGSTQHYKADVLTVHSIIEKYIPLLNKYEISTDKLVYVFNCAAQFDKMELLFNRKICRHYAEIEEFIDRYVMMLLKGSQGVLTESDLLDEKEVTEKLPLLNSFCEIIRNEIKL